ncbi:AAA family ATPase, partial [Persicitalea sp.]|uniref:AAA family ATPase n=1 Tax=Persicitalea sp. TaxID=3100273 RepID=UPI0035940E9E
SEQFIKSNDNDVLHIVNFNRIFIKNADLVRVKEISDQKLGIDCSNLEKVLNRLLEDEITREDITEYLELFIPGFEKIEIDSNNLSGTDTLLIYEKGIDKPFTKDLISDGTYNIICLLTAVFQSDEPQFLCIEEPENGLNPYVVQQFVELCRLMCEDYGHYIWLNTHSQTLVRALKEKELILVDKENGATQIKQFEKGDFYGLKADEAWLTNSLGAGIPW